MQSNHQDTPLAPEESRSRRAESTFWGILGTLVRWRRFIAIVTGLVAVAAVVISLLLPNEYEATSRVLLPESGGGLAASLLRNLPSSASALLGGGGGDYVRYLAILNSRSVAEAAIDSFDLIRVYDLEDSKTPRQNALETFADMMTTEIDMEFNFLSVSVVDLDPQRSADISNFLVRRLNDINARFSSQSAATYRSFIEDRYYEAEAEMDSVLNAMQDFQEQYGVYDLTAQTQSFFEQIASLRAQALEAEVQHEVLVQQYGPENPQGITAREVARAANRKYQQALAGSERLLPIPQDAVPQVVRRYADLELERTIQATILETIRPMFEQARFQEEQEIESVQVLDQAIPPVKKVGPRRSIICIAATFSAFLLACLFALAYSWWQRNHARYAHRLRQAVDEEAPTPHQTPVS